MTEEEWLNADGFNQLITLVKELNFNDLPGVSPRKLVLAEIAGTQRVVHLFPDDLCRQVLAFAIRAVEEPALRLAPERAKLAEKWVAYKRSLHERDTRPRWAEYYNAGVLLQFSLQTWQLCCGVQEVVYWEPDSVTEHDVVAALLRDIFGNPFRPVAFAPEWRTDTAVALALQMYDSRDFSAMPILADALQDAGCDNADVLNHCRGDGPHVRGCWVVDLVLGKE